ncbi:plant UBX domain-containing protein 4-like [Spinacia oleracea]|uniref:Plant UBX domain-containing protein 4-like n=1 Tax=Spinacia oleracea TaxID=3562 RepID=A0A9R0IXW1_SPIOL|nr:plant UBX domain-containing protein 4-like [Spinacia oleracea]
MSKSIAEPGTCQRPRGISAEHTHSRTTHTCKEGSCQSPEPVKRVVSFQGVGRTLGDNSSAISEQTVPRPLNSAQPPSAGLVVDQSQPSTPIQLRLADGTRMVAHFNYNHTINDIRAFIDASRSGGSRTYQLQTVGFPPEPLNDLKQTIEQAGLANSVAMRKL